MAVNINGDTGIDKVQPGSVDGVDLTDGSVTEGKIGTGAVTADKIGAGAVTSAKLDTNISVPGTVTATSFSGDGSSLTGIAGGFSNMEVFTSSGTWTNPGNVTKVKVTVVGGGGSGGGAANGYGSWSAGGGGGGGTAIEVIPFPSATNVPVTVGNGGPVKNISNSNLGYVGNTGGTSSFGSYCSATGGEGGRGIEQPNAYGDGGTASGGTLNITGGPGTKYWGYPSFGAGGGSYMGFGGMGARHDNTYTPVPGTGYGGGGSGASTGGPGSSGSGSAGVVIVEY